MRDEPVVPITSVRARAYKIPTESPESDGTLKWDSTTLVICEVEAGAEVGLGYTYAHAGAAQLINQTLGPLIGKHNALNGSAAFHLLCSEIRNLGPGGVATMAVSAVDNALWDLKGKLYGLPLSRLLGELRQSVAAYGSGGFTSLSKSELQQHVAAWVEQGYRMVKMKVGRDPAADPERVVLAKKAIGPDTKLFVDANGGYDVKQAVAMAQRFRADADVSWLEEPVSHQNLPGLRRVRALVKHMDIAAGEYGYGLDYFQAMLHSGAVDVLQADATRCGISGFLQAAILCEANGLALSSHCAPSLHVGLGVATRQTRHLEFFYDHVRIERRFFEGAPVPKDGQVAPDPSRPGLGIAFKFKDAEAFAL